MAATIPSLANLQPEVPLTVEILQAALQASLQIEDQLSD